MSFSINHWTVIGKSSSDVRLQHNEYQCMEQFELLKNTIFFHADLKSTLELRSMFRLTFESRASNPIECAQESAVVEMTTIEQFV